MPKGDKLTPKKKRSRGQPTKYKSEYAEQVYKLAVKGLTDKELADFFKVREQTVNNWKNRYPEFFESLKRGKDEFDSNVIEKSLARRATGYQYTETTKAIDKEGELVITKEVVKEIAPDPTSMIFWLKNRRPDRWRDVQQVEATLTIEELWLKIAKERDESTS